MGVVQSDWHYSTAQVWAKYETNSPKIRYHVLLKKRKALYFGLTPSEYCLEISILMLIEHETVLLSPWRVSYNCKECLKNENLNHARSLNAQSLTQLNDRWHTPSKLVFVGKQYQGGCANHNEDINTILFALNTTFWKTFATNNAHTHKVLQNILFSNQLS